MATFKTIGKENISIVEETDSSSHYTVDGNNMRVYQILPKNDGNFTNDGVSHIVGGLLGLQSDAIADNYNVSYAEGGFNDTALDGVYDSYYTAGGVLISLGDDVYRQSIIGRDVAFRLPISSGATGVLSGMSAVTLYSAFFDQPNALDVKRDSKCGGAIFDCQRFETLLDATINSGIGSAAEPGNTGDNYKSCIVYLFADELSFTTGSTTGNSFTTGHMATSPYGVSNKFKPDFFTERAVGVLNCCSGNAYIFDSDLVGSFDYSAALSGGTGTTGYVYSPGDLYANIQDYDSSKGIQIKIVANPGEFTIQNSTNKSKEQATIDGLDCGDLSYITGICMTDNTGTPVAFGTLDEAVSKTENGFAIFNMIASLDGGILDNSFDNGVTRTT